jgi:hypothetical protein
VARVVAVYRNGGAPGIDQTTLAEVQEYGVTRLLEEVATELWEGSVTPLCSQLTVQPVSGMPSGPLHQQVLRWWCPVTSELRRSTQGCGVTVASVRR